MKEFGCSQRLATKAKHLAIEKGILTTPNPKVGRTLSKDTEKKVKEFYYLDDVSRVCQQSYARKERLLLYLCGWAEKVIAEKAYTW